MKKSAIAVAILLGLFALAAAGPAQAQLSFRVNIPFEFAAGPASLPAGEYDVQPGQIGGPALVFRSTEGGAAAIVLTMAAQAKDLSTDSKLVFHRYGNRYFLSRMWVQGSRYGSALREPPAEIELARNQTSHEVTLQARLSVPQH